MLCWHPHCWFLPPWLNVKDGIYRKRNYKFRKNIRAYIYNALAVDTNHFRQETTRDQKWDSRLPLPSHFYLINHFPISYLYIIGGDFFYRRSSSISQCVWNFFNSTYNIKVYLIRMIFFLKLILTESSFGFFQAFCPPPFHFSVTIWKWILERY